KSAVATVRGRRQLPIPQRPKINIAMSVSKWDSCEWVIEKAVELGVDTFLPIISENSFIKKPQDLPATRLKRWQKLIESATTQTARGSLMSLRPPLALSEFLNEINRKPDTACLFAYEGAQEVEVRSELQKLIRGNPDEIWALVG